MFSDIRVRDENTPALQSGKIYTTPGLQPQRKKGLTDITNKPGLTPKLGTLNKAPASSRTAFRNITNTGLRQDENKGIDVRPGKKSKGALADRSKHNGVPADLKRTAHLYALQGVEHVHMTGRQMEAIMAEKQEEEITQRVATVLAFRTDMPSLLPSSRLSSLDIDEAPMYQEVEPPAPDESWDHGFKPHTSTRTSNTWDLDTKWVDPLEGCQNDWDLGVLNDEDIDERYAYSLASN